MFLSKLPKYSYQAKNTNGQDVEGVVEADSKKIAVSLLKDRGYIVYSINDKKGGVDLSFITDLRGVSGSEKVNFTRNLAAMIGSGLPLAQALEILVDQAQSAKLKEVTNVALKDVQSGTPLSVSLEKSPEVFDTKYISLIKAGEASGKLDKVLDRLATSLQKENDFKAKLKGAMIYPFIIMIAMAGVFVIIVVFVVPKLVDMYDSFDIELPLATQVMIAISDFTINRWYIVIILLVASFVGFRWFSKTKEGKYLIGRAMLKLPVFGQILKERDLTEFSRSLALLTASGVSIVDSLTIARDSVSNVLYKDAASEFINKVRQGSPLSTAVSGSKYYPLIVSRMIRVGEETGKTDETLSKLSEYYEKEVDRKVENLSTAIEPLIMVALGAMVGLLIISVITPIYKLTTQF